MKIRPFLFLPFAVLAASCATGKAGDNNPVAEANDPVIEAALASNAEFGRTRFIEKGLQPIEEAARDGREVRRILVRAWVPGDLPALELEKLPDGSVTLALARGGAVEKRVPVPAGTWARFAALDAGVYAPPPPRAPVSESARSASCHGTGALFESASGGVVRSASADQCVNASSPFNEARRETMNTLVDLALAAQPGCERKLDESMEWLLSRCFGAPHG